MIKHNVINFWIHVQHEHGSQEVTHQEEKTELYDTHEHLVHSVVVCAMCECVHA